MDTTYRIVPEPIFKKYVIISQFFSSSDYSLSRFEVLRGININNIEISPMEKTLLVAGIKSYLKQNYCELSDTTLKSLNIYGVTENELIAAPNLRCGSEQTYHPPHCMSIENNLIDAILTHTMVFCGSDSSEFLSSVLLGGCISREGAKFLGKVLLQEPNLILRILQDSRTAGGTIFKEITEDHMIQSLKLNPDINPKFKKDPIFKLFNVKDLEGLFNVVIKKISQRPRKEEDEFLLEAAVDCLQLTNKIAKIINISTNIKNDTRPICLNHDVNQILLEYLPAQDIIYLIEIVIETVVASQSLNLINTPISSRQDVRNLEHQMSALGSEDQESSSGSILPAEPLMECSVKMAPETRKFS